MHRTVKMAIRPGSRPRPPVSKKQLEASYPKFIESVRIEAAHIKTIRCEVQVPAASQPAIFCPVCQIYVLTQVDMQFHMEAFHNDLFLLEESNCFPRCSQLFFVSCGIEKTSLAVSVSISNIGGESLDSKPSDMEVRNVYLATKTTIISVFSGTRLLSKFAAMTVTIPRQSLAFPVNLIIQCLGDKDYFEQHRIWATEPMSFILNKARFCLNEDARAGIGVRRVKPSSHLNYPPLTALFGFIDTDFLLKHHIQPRDLASTAKLGRLSVSTKSLYDLYRNFRRTKVIEKDAYVNTLMILNAIEDLFVSMQLDKFVLQQRCDGPSMRQWRGQMARMYSIDVKVQDQKGYMCLLKEGDTIHLSPIRTREDERVSKVNCTIVQIENSEIKFVQNEQRGGEIRDSVKYDITFSKTRFGFFVEQHALESLQVEMIEHILFPQPPAQHPNCKPVVGIQWNNPSIQTNQEQQQAIQCILQGSFFPAPYLIFGPPGTGKTSTLVEAVCQLLQQNNEIKVLVTATSNFACDEICTRLTQFIHPKEIFRFYSKASQAKDIDSNITVDSNSIPGFETPGFNSLQTYRIVVATLTMAGRLGVDVFPRGLFEYIFIDECASAAEPTAIIPIALLAKLSQDGKLGTKIVLAGDPKQLGPIINCRLVANPGLNKSLMERLMEFDLYKPTHGRYNSRYITKLLQNFRSHPAILHIPNKLFYEGQLQPKAGKHITDFALGWSYLPNPRFPILFYPVQGYAQTDPITQSICNDAEVDIVCNYATEISRNGINGHAISQEEIGVVSFYRKQCSRIRTRFSKSPLLSEIAIGSAESFQGQEKLVIILSTVRSSTDSIGFLSNPRRLNVVLTRAKGLMIIIGNQKTLKLDPNWSELIDYCEENFAVHVEGPAVVKDRKAVIESLQDLRLKLIEKRERKADIRKMF